MRTCMVIAGSLPPMTRASGVTNRQPKDSKRSASIGWIAPTFCAAAAHETRRPKAARAQRAKATSRLCAQALLGEARLVAHYPTLSQEVQMTKDEAVHQFLFTNDLSCKLNPQTDAESELVLLLLLLLELELELELE